MKDFLRNVGAKMSEWINIKDKAPEHNQFVLCIGSSNNMMVLRCDMMWANNYVFMSPDLTHQIRGVTHWMELPEPPK